MRPLRVGVVGCGIIAKRYVADSTAFPTFDVVACADVDVEAARRFAEEHRLEALGVDELIASDELDLVLNLTPPAVHEPLVGATLDAGKHSYTEKPLAMSIEGGACVVQKARSLGLRIGCAPDTFLGGAYSAARDAIARGDIGEPIGATAQMLTGGPEGWHPNADFFYRAGGGPLLDIGPYYLTALVSLLGPFAAASGFVATPTLERELGVGPRAGQRFSTEVPTHVACALQTAAGAIATLTVSFEARGRYESGMIVHGTEGSLSLPDANAFLGDVCIRRDRDDWEPLAYESRGDMETRGLGLHELVESLEAGRPHRASGELALHVLETIDAVLRSAEEGRTIEVAPLLEAEAKPRKRVASG
ncbi:MAG TPA: Gfo/Idh/MocA family oxidoreductase [Gaiellaceae bacterium]|nr:Gfo/Idh/MocA family oxidoreductase [Gaiellaceae bacterium]